MDKELTYLRGKSKQDDVSARWLGNLYVSYEKTSALVADRFDANGVSKDEIREYEQFITGRLARTLKRLKEKGVCVSDLFTLLSSMISNHEPQAMWLGVYVGNKVQAEHSVSGSVPIKDEIWFQAIESIAVKYDAGKIDDITCKNLTPVIQGHEAELRATAVLLCYADCMSSSEFGQTSKPLTEQIKQLEGSLSAAEKENSELKQQLQALTTRLHETEQRQSQSDIFIETAKKTLHEIELSRINALEQAKMDLRKVHEENAILRKLLKTVTTGVPKEAEPTEETLNEEPEEYAELPDEGVIFLGGHKNLIGKVRKLHPNWCYINEDSSRHYDLRKNQKVIFYWANHTSHATQNIAWKKTGKQIPIIYVAATNIAMLEDEMRRGYAKVAEKTQM